MRRAWLSSFVGILLLGVAPLVARADSPDADADGVPDDADVCVLVADPAQRDADADGFGNVCDADFDQNGIVNFLDLAVLKARFLEVDPVVDLTGDGIVNFLDLAAFRRGFLQPPGPKCAGCPIDPCARAKDLLCPALGIVAADDALAACLAATDPVASPQRFQTATFLRGITRVVRPVFEQRDGADPNGIDSLAEALDALGVGGAGRDPFDFRPTLPFGLDGRCLVPEGVREADVERALTAELLPALDASLASLPAVPADWSDTCSVDRFGRAEMVEIDGSDALLLRAHLHGLRAALHLLAADDLDFDLGALCTAFREGPLPTIETFLRDHPDFGVRTAAPAAQAAKLDVLEALDLLEAAFDAVRAETDPQPDDLAFIDAGDPQGFTPAFEAAIDARIEYARASLLAPVLAPPGILLPREIAERICGDPSFRLGALFDGPGVRPVLPPFVANLPDVDAVPDPTFGGLFPEQEPGDLRCAADQESPRVTFARPFVLLVQNDEPFRRALSTVRADGAIPLSMRIEDPRVGAGPGSPIFPPGVLVRVSTETPSYTSCLPVINGEAQLGWFRPAPTPGGPSNVLDVVLDPEGALVLEATVDVAITTFPPPCGLPPWHPLYSSFCQLPPQGSCRLYVEVLAADIRGEPVYAVGTLLVRE